MINFDLVLEWIENKTHFTYSRFGDGELNAIFNKDGQNCDGHIYYRELGESLKKIIQSKPDYFIGLQNLGDKKYQDLEDWQELRSLIDWEDMEIFTRASIKGRLNEFAELLRTKNVIQVANHNIRKLDLANRFIEVSDLNCWNERGLIMTQIMSKIKDGDIVIYSCGMSAKVFIDKVYSIFGKSITQIDCGSVWDYYAGINSRSYMNNLEINKEI